MSRGAEVVNYLQPTGLKSASLFVLPAVSSLIFFVSQMWECVSA